MDLGHAAARGMTCGLVGSFLAVALGTFLVLMVLHPSAATISSIADNDMAATLADASDASGFPVPSTGDTCVPALDPGVDSSGETESGERGVCPPTRTMIPRDLPLRASERMWFLGVPFFLISGRVKKNRLLEHPVRKRIVDAVSAHPGIHHRQLLRDLGLSNGTVAYHLHLLERAGYLRSSYVRGRKCLLVPGETRGLADLSLTDLERALMASIYEIEEGRLGELGRAVGLTAGGAAYHVKHLRDLGFVEVRRQGRAIMISRALE